MDDEPIEIKQRESFSHDFRRQPSFRLTTMRRRNARRAGPVPVPGSATSGVEDGPPALVGERVGPFKVTFPLDIEILEAVEGRRLRAAATGKDPAIGSSMKMGLDLSIDEDGGQTVLDIKTDVSILGKLGALGHSMIKRKADEMMGKFAQALKVEVEKA